MKKTSALLALFSSLSFANTDLTREEQQYQTLFAFNSTEMTPEEAEGTEGKAGPLITGGIGAVMGAGGSVMNDWQNGRPANLTNAIVAGGAGFAAGATGAWIGGAAGAFAGGAMGIATSFSGGAACGSCHVSN
ncbi:hypothetical protein [Vibrio coralliilyticus]|uniref:hypothetical protein n=1 Tax=Vibrio coralliilyticus TaxID=190893 RepID=UPI000BAAEC63|nr:hypothetical protein [Vibrio coralliilyticus]NOI60848.1 hypothetical protein [Vibrio coralliilyticus]PAT65631.1 hypothetical protein CKA27_23790 [Vibrio coralliilyticus]